MDRRTCGYYRIDINVINLRLFVQETMSNNKFLEQLRTIVVMEISIKQMDYVQLFETKDLTEDYGQLMGMKNLGICFTNG
jgi:RNA binding exosome subunit